MNSLIQSSKTKGLAKGVGRLALLARLGLGAALLIGAFLRLYGIKLAVSDIVYSLDGVDKAIKGPPIRVLRIDQGALGRHLNDHSRTDLLPQLPGTPRGAVSPPPLLTPFIRCGFGTIATCIQ